MQSQVTQLNSDLNPSTMITGGVIDYAESLPICFRTISVNERTSQTPSTLNYGTGYIEKSGETDIVIILHNVVTKETYTKRRSNIGWGDWETYALKSDFKYKELTNEFDLNNALGKYRTDSSAIIASLKNKPSEIRNSGEATIDWYPANERNTYGIQIMRWTFGTAHMIFARNKLENTWAEWAQYVTRSDLDKGQFVVKVEENFQKVITSQSDIVRGTLPSQMKDCAYAAVGFSTTIDNELSIVVDGNSIIVSPKKTNNAVTINWFQFN